MCDKKILILGAGSVGKRHAQNLLEQGCRIVFYDPRQDRCDEVEKSFGNKVKAYSDYYKSYEEKSLEGVVIASPTSFHVQQSSDALEKKIPVLLEKPVAITLGDALQLSEVSSNSNTPILLGYTWRWWEPLREIKAMLSDNKIGVVRHVQMNLSAHLADWHPWENYQDFFMANKELGGGALLDESHWIDLMLWFFGMPESIFGTVEKISDLEIDSDDNVDFIAFYQNGLRVVCHLDLYGRPHERSIRFTGDNGSILWSSEPNETRVTVNNCDEQIIKHSCERNDMFFAVTKEFLQIMGKKESNEQRFTCTLEEGIQVMRVIEAIRKSQEKSKVITLG